MNKYSLFKPLFIFCLIFCNPIYSTTIEETQLKILEILPSFPGWCSSEKALELFNLAIKTKPSLCVEIGVFGGSSLLPIASALKHLGKGIVIGIDPWDPREAIKHFNLPEDEENLAWWSSLDFEKIFQEYSRLFSKHHLNDHVITIKSTSALASTIITTPIDILHLDGNHSEFGIISDITLYLPKVRPGGYIWLNDILSKSIQPAIKLLVNSCDIVKIIDKSNCILFKKREEV